MTEAPAPRIERWLRDHADLTAALVIALGLVARLRAARGPFRTPDEVLHLEMAGAGSVADLYRASLGNAHPPLFLILLHYWRTVAASDWSLRLLPVAFGTLFLWAFHRWARRLFGEGAALFGLAFAALLPSVVLVSSELRGYALLLCMIAAALAALERALDEASPGWMAAFAACAVLALLSHYAALRFAAAAFVYAAARLAIRPRSPRLLAAFALSQAALAGVALFLYISHLSALHGGALEREARSTWLGEAYFPGSGVGPVAFLARQTISLFHYLFSATVPGLVALGLCVLAVVRLARRREASFVLIGLPFAIAAAGGLGGVYPYAGTRHSIDLAIFAAAGVGVALAPIVGERRWAALVAVAALAPAAFLAAG